MMNEAAPRPPARSPAGQRPADEALHTLIVRTWKEAGTGTVRARLLDAAARPPTTWATAEGTDAICAAVRAWLEQRP